MKVSISDRVLIFWGYYTGFKSLLRKWHVNKKSFFLLCTLCRYFQLTGKEMDDPINFTHIQRFYKITSQEFNNRLSSLSKIGLIEKRGVKYYLTDRAIDVLNDFDVIVLGEMRVNRFHILPD